MKKLSATLALLILLTFATTTAFASTPTTRNVLVPFSFSIYVNTDDDNWSSKDYVYRDVEILGASPAYIRFTSLTDAANSLNLRIHKWNPATDRFTAVASISKMVTSNTPHSINIPYNTTYNEESGAYKLYAWTTRNDCSAQGNWTP